MQSIIGHEYILKHFGELIQRKSLAHAYFFTGPVSVGKTTLMRHLGQMILCENRVGDDTCASCSAFAKDQHPDFLLLDPDTQENTESVAVDAVRELERRAQLKPVFGAMHVSALAHADRLHPSAANALLKIVEEPPRQMVFFLSAETPNRIPVTLRSRMQRFYCRPVPAEAIAVFVKGQGETKDRSEKLACMALGSPGIALRALHDTAHEERYSANLDAWARLLARPAQIFQWTRDGEKEKSDLRAFLATGHMFLHDLLRAQYGLRTRIASSFLSSETLTALAHTYRTKKIKEMSEELLRALGLLQTNVSPTLLLENLFLSFI